MQRYNPSMLSYHLSGRIWAALCTIAAFLLFLLFWGPPSWTAVFPQGMVFRFLDALWCDVFILALYCVPSFLNFRRKKYGIISLFVGCCFLAIFCILVVKSKSLDDLDFLVLVFAIVVLATLFFLSAFQIIAKHRESVHLAGQDLFRVIWSLATPVLWLLFFIFGIFQSQFWFAFHVLGGLLLLVPLASVFIIKESATLSLSSADLKKRFGISLRETEVIDLLKDGLTNQEIADRLFISVTTVKSHLSHIYEKTETRNRVELLGIIRSNDGESDFRRIANSGVEHLS